MRWRPSAPRSPVLRIPCAGSRSFVLSWRSLPKLFRCIGLRSRRASNAHGSSIVGLRDEKIHSQPLGQELGDELSLHAVPGGVERRRKYDLSARHTETHTALTTH